MKKTVLFICIMAVFSVISGCGQEKPEVLKPISDTLTRDEYAVYRDIMSQEFQGRGETLVKERTLIPHNAAGFGTKVREQMHKEFGRQLKESLIDRFVAANQKSAVINEEILSYKGASVLTIAAEKEMFTNDQIYYEDFRSRYPSPARMVEFSRVAFNGKTDMAIAYFGKIFYSEKESAGYYLFLKKTKGKWVIDKRLTAWKL